jgi:hypothetical protein
VVYYPFDECADDSPDANGFGPSLALTDGECEPGDLLSTALETVWQSGTALRCMAMPWPCASAPDDAVFEPPQFTISAWVYNDDWSDCGDDGSPGEEACTIVSKANTDACSNGYWFSIGAGTGTPRVSLTIASPQGGEHQVIGGELSNATWHHVAATFAGKTSAIYLDGERVGQLVTGGISYGSEDFLVGAMTDRGYSHDGLIEEIRLWNCVNDDAQIKALYDAYVGG